jgi:hypothetical protein
MNDVTQIFPIQSVRLLEVFVVAPFLVYAGRYSTDKTIKYGLIGLGILTALYNGMDYLKEEKDGK